MDIIIKTPTRIVNMKNVCSIYAKRIPSQTPKFAVYAEMVNGNRYQLSKEYSNETDAIGVYLSIGKKINEASMPSSSLAKTNVLVIDVY